jgi:hypothetical protein
MNPTQTFSPGSLVRLRGRDWIVQPSETPEELLVIKPLGGGDDETTGIFLPLGFSEDVAKKAEFPKPAPEDLGNSCMRPRDFPFATAPGHFAVWPNSPFVLDPIRSSR